MAYYDDPLASFTYAQAPVMNRSARPAPNSYAAMAAGKAMSAPVGSHYDQGVVRHPTYAQPKPGMGPVVVDPVRPTGRPPAVRPPAARPGYAPFRNLAR